ncbi:MAG: hypothetical protein ABSA41_16555 [Terriglobia bacterium]|jgi:hypothetical protein
MLDITELYCSHPANASVKTPRLGDKLEVLGYLTEEEISQEGPKQVLAMENDVLLLERAA